MSASPTNNWRVELPSGGREGYLSYCEGDLTASWFWELGGGDVVLIIHLGTVSEWRAKYPWAAERRAEIVERLKQTVIGERGPAWKCEMQTRDDGYSYLLVRDQNQPAEPHPDEAYERARAKYIADGSLTTPSHGDAVMACETKPRGLLPRLSTWLKGIFVHDDQA